jgi:hypothetical protein
VIDMMGRYIEGGCRLAPVVVYAGFGTRAAAEMARDEVIECLIDNGCRYGPSEVTIEMWERFAAGHD